LVARRDKPWADRPPSMALKPVFIDSYLKIGHFSSNEATVST
jgi:hypothetical protein